MNQTIAVLYTTIKNEQDARNLAHLAVTQKLATCVNIFPKGKSVIYLGGAS